ncbi:DUF5996 family protein [Catenulispora sp. GP43]|uniref:DUF5996 family protein n=1 Tax=Catenulispora sp. GP43 TaxID=3156263 RepID=UPI003513DD76
MAPRTSERGGPAWPELPHEQLAPMAAYLNRLVQIGSKYTLDAPFETGWGNIVLAVTPRGLRTPTFRQNGVTFAVHYRLLDGDAVLETDRGSVTLPLADGTVAGFYAAFLEAAASLGVPPPASTLFCEIADCAPRFADDKEHRRWDAEAAALVHRAFDLAAGGLEAWQAPFLGHRPRVGVMWGGFDLSATRWRPGERTEPTPGRPAFQQNAELEPYVSVGFAFGSGSRPEPGMYAYIWPQPEGLERCDWGVEGAAWHPDEGLVLLPWLTLRQMADPHQAIITFGDAVYAAAVRTAGWPAELVGPRCDGWHMSTVPPDTNAFRGDPRRRP